MMIRNILILTVLAALVPTAMSNVSASADSEIALFSTASVDTDSLSIIGNGDSAKMELKATNDDGKSNRVAGFQLTADNVLLIDEGDKVTVKDNVDFTKAITTDSRNNQKIIGITSNGVIDFAVYNQGVYKLDVVVNDDKAYEAAIVVIGGQTKDSVESVNKQIFFEIYYGNNTSGGGSGNITNSGSAGGSNMTENSNFAGSGGSNMTENSNFAGSGGDGGSNMTQGISEFATVPVEPEPLNEVICMPEETPVDGKCVPNPLVSEPEPESIPVVNCYEGWHEDASGTCQPDDQENPTVPSCDLNPNQPECETTSESLELATLPEDEELPEEEEQELDDSEEELDEELEEDVSEEEESGESEDESENEDSGEESEGESEEESEGGN